MSCIESVIACLSLGSNQKKFVVSTIQGASMPGEISAKGSSDARTERKEMLNHITQMLGSLQQIAQNNEMPGLARILQSAKDEAAAQR
jgi:hypothetical protein